MRLRIVCALALAGAVGCSDGGSQLSGPARALRETSNLATRRTYKVLYRYSLSGALKTSVDTQIEVSQKPPNRLRKIETTTKDDKGAEVTVPSWAVRRGRDYFTCAMYAEGVNCLPSPGQPGAFGYVQLDEVAQLLQDPRNFASVKDAPNTTIAGEKARCFEAAPHDATPPPVTSPQPRFTPTKFRFELCFASDGILLRIRRRIVGPVPTAIGGTEMVLQATSVSRTVRNADTALPGPVRGAGELLPTPTRSPR